MNEDLRNYEKRKRDEKYCIRMLNLLLFLCISILVSIGFMTFKGINNRNKYTEKMKDVTQYYKHEEYKEALSALEELPNDFKGVPKMRKKITYAYAKSLYKEEKYDTAYEYFLSIRNYKDTKKFIIIVAHKLYNEDMEDVLNE